MKPEPYILILFGSGVLVLLIAWLPMVLKKRPLSLAIVCVLIGVGVFWSGAFDFLPDPIRFSTITERTTELVVIVALMGAGLKLDRPLGLRRWATSWRLIAVTMPLTIVAATLLGVYGLGLGLASALLLGAALAPTDPVLASEVQVGPPRSGEEGEVRFGLTSEAGLNDGLAFPFVHLAVGLAVAETWDSTLLSHWGAVDVGWRIAAGVTAGFGIGKLLGWVTFGLPRGPLSKTRDGLIAIGATLVSYAIAEALHGYGFLAVFLAALTLRATERDHDFHKELHDFAEQIERLLILLVLVLFGGAIAGGLLSSLTWADAAFGLVLVLIVRPLAGWAGLLGSPHPRSDRALVAFLGIRGIGSFYYLAYALNHGRFEGWERLWAIVGFTVLCSIIVHGITATPLMSWVERRKSQANSPEQT